MRPIQRIISVGFATAAIASASLPAVSLQELSIEDFEATVGTVGRAALVHEVEPATEPSDDFTPGRCSAVPGDRSYATVTMATTGTLCR